eukprot:1822044-Amphidinium_carterae.1
MEENLTTDELFNSKKPQATAAKAALSQAKCKLELEELLKLESSEEGFHDDRDAADKSGVPTEQASSPSRVRSHQGTPTPRNINFR